MRPRLYTATWCTPPSHSHAHIPPRTSIIDARIVRLANIMGRPAEDVEGEIHSVIARRFALTNEQLPLGVAIRCHGEAQAFYDAFKLRREWPEEEKQQ